VAEVPVRVAVRSGVEALVADRSDDGTGLVSDRDVQHRQSFARVYEDEDPVPASLRRVELVDGRRRRVRGERPVQAEPDVRVGGVAVRVGGFDRQLPPPVGARARGVDGERPLVHVVPVGVGKRDSPGAERRRVCRHGVDPALRVSDGHRHVDDVTVGDHLVVERIGSGQVRDGRRCEVATGDERQLVRGLDRTPIPHVVRGDFDPVRPVRRRRGRVHGERPLVHVVPVAVGEGDGAGAEVRGVGGDLVDPQAVGRGHRDRDLVTVTDVVVGPVEVRRRRAGDRRRV